MANLDLINKLGSLERIKKQEQKNLSSLVYRLQHGGGHKSQGITKAIGTSSTKTLNVIDATCGLGTDSIVLAYFNCQVYAIERHPTIAALLTQRLEQAIEHRVLNCIIPKIKLFIGDCIKLIPEIISEGIFIPDVIYLDPMFNKKTKGAPNKLIQTLQSIIVNEPLGDAVFESNINSSHNLLTSILNLPNLSAKRIVVKRSRSDPYLDNLPADFSLTGKSSRFDVYITH